MKEYENLYGSPVPKAKSWWRRHEEAATRRREWRANHPIMNRGRKWIIFLGCIAIVWTLYNGSGWVSQLITGLTSSDTGYANYGKAVVKKLTQNVKNPTLTGVIVVDAPNGMRSIYGSTSPTSPEIRTAIITKFGEAGYNCIIFGAIHKELNGTPIWTNGTGAEGSETDLELLITTAIKGKSRVAFIGDNQTSIILPPPFHFTSVGRFTTDVERVRILGVYSTKSMRTTLRSSNLEITLIDGVVKEFKAEGVEEKSTLSAIKEGTAKAIKKAGAVKEVLSK